MRYYKLWNFLNEGDAILTAGPNLVSPFTNWLGHDPWAIQVPQPLDIEIETGDRLLPYYSNPIPLMATGLLQKMKDAGVDNIDDYTAIITDPKSGKQWTDYRALKVIGAIAATDVKLSEGEELDDSGKFGKFFDKAIIDESKTFESLVFRLKENSSYFVVAEKIMEAMLTYPDTYGLRFSPLFLEDEDDDNEIDPDLDYDDLY